MAEEKKNYDNVYVTVSEKNVSKPFMVKGDKEMVNITLPYPFTLTGHEDGKGIDMSEYVGKDGEEAVDLAYHKFMLPTQFMRPATEYESDKPIPGKMQITLNDDFDVWLKRGLGKSVDGKFEPALDAEGKQAQSLVKIEPKVFKQLVNENFSRRREYAQTHDESAKKKSYVWINGIKPKEASDKATKAFLTRNIPTKDGERTFDSYTIPKGTMVNDKDIGGAKLYPAMVRDSKTEGLCNIALVEDKDYKLEVPTGQDEKGEWTHEDVVVSGKDIADAREASIEQYKNEHPLEQSSLKDRADVAKEASEVGSNDKETPDIQKAKEAPEKEH